jgi:hypothetical protein
MTGYCVGETLAGSRSASLDVVACPVDIRIRHCIASLGAGAGSLGKLSMRACTPDLASLQGGSHVPSSIARALAGR